MHGILFFIKFCVNFRRIPNAWFLKKCLKQHIQFNDVKYNSKKKVLTLIKAGIEVEKGKNDYLLDSIRYIINLVTKANAIFFQEDDNLYVKIGRLKYMIQNSEELYILHEISVKGIYGCGGEKEFVLLDIGMNVGFASLYFSSQDKCKKVIAFEHFKPTYEQALCNFNLNEDFKSKIYAFNYGLGHEDIKLEIKYYPQLKGGMSTTFVNNREGMICSSEPIEIKKADIVFDGLKLKEFRKEGYKIIAKIDCEGAEYNIIQALFDSHSLQNIDVLMMEWHRSRPEKLTRLLAKSDFDYFLFDPFENYGMIYAVKAGYIQNSFNKTTKLDNKNAECISNSTV